MKDLNEGRLRKLRCPRCKKIPTAFVCTIEEYKQLPDHAPCLDCETKGFVSEIRCECGCGARVFNNYDEGKAIASVKRILRNGYKKEPIM